MISKQLDVFLTEVQCEELYTEDVKQELIEYYQWLHQHEYEQEPNQSGQ